MQDFEIIGEITDIETIAVGRRIMRPQPETSRRESPRTIPDYLSNFFQIAIVCLVATLVANAGEQPTTKANAELQLLQGTWEGVMVGQEKDGNITVTISSNSLHFHRDTNFWFETTFTQPVGTGPKQLHATIKECADKQSVGKVVVAIYKIEDGTLTLATGNGGGEEMKSFKAAPNRYELRKVQPQKKDTEPPKTK